MGSISLKLIPTIDLLAYVNTLQGRFEEAAAHYQRARHIAEKEFGVGGAEVVPRIENEALNYFCAGDLSRSEALFRQAHDALIAAGVDGYDPRVTRVVNNMATVTCRKGPTVF